MALALFAVSLVGARPVFGQAAITVPKTQAWGLPESIRREALVVLDRGREFLASRQGATGLWALADGTLTCGPAFGFVDDEPPAQGSTPALSRAANAAADLVERDVRRVLSVGETVELARAALLLRLADVRPDLVTRTARRLSVVGTDALGAGDAVVALAVRDEGGAPAQGYEWGAVLAAATGLRRQTGASVALAGLARGMRGAASDGNAVRAYVRWLARPRQVSAEDAWWTARFVSALPPAVLHDAGYPLDWRQRVANELISRQRRDTATGNGFWTVDRASPPDSDDALRETTFAVMTLALVAG